MTPKRTKIFITIISVILLTPLVLTALRVKVIPRNNKGREIKLNFKRNFPLKEDIIKIHSYFKKTWLKNNVAPNIAIECGNGWSVVGDSFGDAFSESKGLLVFSKKELKVIKKNLIERNNWLKERGINFYVAIAPNKLTVYDTLVPIVKNARNTKLKQVDSLCKKHNIRFVDMGGKFKEYDQLRLYHKTDTHWNGNGGFLGYSISMDSIRKDYPDIEFKSYKIDDVKTWVRTEEIGDLHEMLFKKKSEEYIHLDPFESNATLIADKLQLPKKYRKDPQAYEVRYKNNKGNLKFLAFRDSFFGYCTPFFNENFKESLYIWNHVFDKEIIENEKPDIVFFELVERNIDFLLEKSIP